MNKNKIISLALMASTLAFSVNVNPTFEHTDNSTSNKKSSSKSKKAKAKIKAQKNARKINRGRK